MSLSMLMKKPVSIIGMGEMGGVFARGFLKTGHPVYPIVRGMNISTVQKELPECEAVIVAVGEKDLQNVLTAIPSNWQDKLVLLQNELLPRDWQAHQIQNPTVIAVWFEKKHPNDYKVLIPSPVCGPKAELVKSALESIHIPCQTLTRPEDLLFALIVKNLYILTINIAGLVAGGTVSELWSQHNKLAREIANDILDVQFSLIDQTFDREQLIEGMLKAFAGDPQHKCLGRTALSRLERAISHADQAKLKVKKLREISLQQATAKQI